MNLKEISTADAQVVESDFNADLKLLRIRIKNCVQLSDNQLMPLLDLYVQEWDEVKLEKHIVKRPFGEAEVVNISSQDLEDSFEIIQEITYYEDFIQFSGFSKENGCWMVFKFKKPTIGIITIE